MSAHLTRHVRDHFASVRRVVARVHGLKTTIDEPSCARDQSVSSPCGSTADRVVDVDVRENAEFAALAHLERRLPTRYVVDRRAAGVNWTSHTVAE